MTSASTLRVALAQICTTGEIDSNLTLLQAGVAQAAAEGARLVVFPEASMRAFGHNLTSIAQELDGPFASALSASAQEHQITVVAGMFTPGESAAHVRNTLLAASPDGTLTGYDKIHLYDAFGFKESDTVQAGAAPVIVDVDGVQVGLATCYDVRFPALFSDLARRGAQVIVLAASWGSGPGKVDQWQLLTAARALDSTSYVLACDQAEPGASDVQSAPGAPTGVGASQIIDPFGAVLARAGAEPQMLLADLELDRVTHAREAIAVLSNARTW